METVLYRSTTEQVVEAIQVQDDMEIPTPNGVVKVSAGGWLILDEHGNLGCCSNMDFQCTYEIAGDSDRDSDSEGKPCGC